MARNVISLTGTWSACLVAVVLAKPAQGVATKTWDGGGGNSSWGTAANWNPDGVPGPADTVEINVVGPLTVAVGAAAGSIASLTCSNGLSVSANLTVTGATIFNAGSTLTLSSAVLDLQGGATIGGAFNWTAGTLDGAGTSTVSSTGVLSMTTGTHTLSTALAIDGDGSWSGGAISFDSGTLTVNHTFTIGGAINVNATAVSGSSGNAFVNNGTVTKVGASTTTFSGANSGVAFSNTGTLVDVQAGTLALSGGGSHTGDFTGTLGSTISFGGAHTLGPSVDFSGDPSIAFTTGTTTYGGPITTAGNITNSGANTTLGGAIDAGGIAVSSGTLTLNAASSTGSLSISAGTLVVNSALGIGGAFAWTAGALDGGGTTMVEATGSLSIISGTHTLSTALVVDGDGAWTGGSITFDGGTLTANHTFTFGGANNISAVAASGSTGNAFINNGMATKTGASTFTFSSANSGVAFDNNGTVDVQAGTLAMSAGGVHTGDFTGSAGATASFGGNHVFSPLVDVTGNLNLAFTSGVRSYDGAITTTGNITNSGAITTLGGAIDAGGIAVSSGTLTLNAASSTGSLSISGGTLVVNSALGIGGAFAWTAGALDGGGTTTVEATGSLSIISGTHTLSTALVVDGDGAWTGGSITFDGGTLTANHTFTFGGANNISAVAASGSTGNAFINNGTATKTGASTFTFSSANSGVAFNNNGTVDVQAGTLAMSAGGMHTGDFTGSAGATISFGGTQGFSPSVGFAGSPNIAFTSGSGTVVSPMATTGSVSNSGGTHDLNGAVDAGSIVVSSGTLTLNAPSNADSASLSGGTLAVNSALGIAGAFDWITGALSGGGTTTVEPTGSLSMTASTHTLSTALVVDGDGAWTAGTITFDGGTLTANHTFALGSANSISAVAASGSAGNAFIDNGTVTKVGASPTTFSSVNGGVAFNNNGTVDVQAGTLSLAGGGSNIAGTTLSGGTWRVVGTLVLPMTSLATLQGQLILDGTTGQVLSTPGNANLLNTLSTIGASGEIDLLNGRIQSQPISLASSGTISIDKTSRLNITGNLTLGGTSLYSIGFGTNGMGGFLNGLSAATGTTTVAGTVRAVQADGFVPAQCDAFVIATAASVTGLFSATDLPAVTSFPIWTVAIQPTQAVLIFADADLDDDLFVGGADLGLLLSQWGGAGTADLNCDGIVNGADLGILLGQWGAMGG